MTSALDRACAEITAAHLRLNSERRILERDPATIRARIARLERSIAVWAGCPFGGESVLRDVRKVEVLRAQLAREAVPLAAE